MNDCSIRVVRSYFTAQYFINNIKIQQVPQAKYLGVYIDEGTSTLILYATKQLIANVRAFLQCNLRQSPITVRERCRLSLVQLTL